jgi:hypothetical protein
VTHINESELVLDNVHRRGEFVVALKKSVASIINSNELNSKVVCSDL